MYIYICKILYVMCYILYMVCFISRCVYSWYNCIIIHLDPKVTVAWN